MGAHDDILKGQVSVVAEDSGSTGHKQLADQIRVADTTLDIPLHNFHTLAEDSTLLD